jgi:hypothetical protein
MKPLEFSAVYVVAKATTHKNFPATSTAARFDEAEPGATTATATADSTAKATSTAPS